jgi:F-type H+-transporting ATPase subunit delta
MPLIHAEPDALARIYSAALLEMAKPDGQGQIEGVLGELEDILEMARGDRAFSEFLASRILPARKREASLKKILGGRVSDLTLKFLLVLNEKDRLGHLPAIVGAYQQAVQENYGRVEVDVYTAQALDGATMEQVRGALQRRLGREPVLHAYTQPSMIGGIKLQVGDQLIDASVETQLRNIRDRLNQDGASKIRSSAQRLIG